MEPDSAIGGWALKFRAKPVSLTCTLVRIVFASIVSNLTEMRDHATILDRLPLRTEAKPRALSQPSALAGCFRLGSGQQRR